jgi:hypothetical protein
MIARRFGEAFLIHPSSAGRNNFVSGKIQKFETLDRGIVRLGRAGIRQRYP